MIANLHDHRDAFGIAGLGFGRLVGFGAEFPGVAAADYGNHDPVRTVGMNLQFGLGHRDFVGRHGPLRRKAVENTVARGARAIAVVQYLVSKGVDPHFLAAAGFGEFQPIDTDRTEEAFSRNRRIELKLTER